MGSDENNKYANTFLSIINHMFQSHPELIEPATKLLLSSFPNNTLKELKAWELRGYQSPSPSFVKSLCLIRHNLPESTWVETGTLYGDTSELLSRHASQVITIEPEPKLFAHASKRLELFNNIQVVNDISENALPRLLPGLRGNICFWLDGHYSAGETFKGPNDTPLLIELDCIKEHLHKYNAVSILIDDIRYCGRKHIYGHYPSLDYLVDFSRSVGLTWEIEHDIFIAKS